MWGGFYVYILASRRNGTLYIGMTDDLRRRVSQHKAKVRPGFTDKYGCDQLVWFAGFPERESAFRRERALKKWRRAWKLRLIEELNPNWLDLFFLLDQPWPDGRPPSPAPPREGGDPGTAAVLSERGA